FEPVRVLGSHRQPDRERHARDPFLVDPLTASVAVILTLALEYGEAGWSTMEWTGARYADKPAVEVRLWISAPPARVWELVSDIELMPALSSELQSVEWLDGAIGPAAGARFIGRSKHEALGEWETTSRVVEFEPERLFGWAVGDPADPAARWRFQLEPKDGGTELSEWVQMGPGRSGLSFAV